MFFFIAKTIRQISYKINYKNLKLGIIKKNETWNYKKKYVNI